MQALVTGAAGFIGSHVVRALLRRGDRVRALHLPGEDLRNLAGLDVELFAGDVTDPESMAKAVDGCQRVFHLAAVYALWLPDMSRLRAVNVGGTRNVLEAARRSDVERVVFTSSIARFGGQGLHQVATEASDFALAPTRNLYAITKAEAHELAAEAAQSGQDVVIVAPTGPIGPGDLAPTPTGRLILECAKAPVVVVPPTVSNFADVRDIATGHLLADEKGVRGRSYLLGAQNYTGREITNMVFEILGVRRPIVDLPFSAAKAVGVAALAYTKHVSRRQPLITPSVAAIAKLGLAADCTRAVRELGLPQSPLQNAIVDAIAWFAHEGYLGDGALRRRVDDLAPSTGMEGIAR